MRTLVLWSVLALAPVACVLPVSAQTSDLTQAPVQWPTIRAGNTSFNARVAAIQFLLRARGFYRGRADGMFGPKTVTAVKAFQRRNGLKVDGVAGPQTLPKLVMRVKRGSRGDAVRAAQILAREAFTHIGETPNANLPVDGNFGAQTEEAVQIAQHSIGGMEGLYLRSDGIMGMRSWCLMLGGRVVEAE